MSTFHKERVKMKRVWVSSILMAAILAACTQSQAPKPVTGKVITIGVMPKLKGIAFMNAVEKGAREAASSLGIQVDFDGPVTNDVTLQAQMAETWIAKKLDAIAIAPNDPEAIGPVLAKARKRGIKVITWDSDARQDARDFFVNQCTPKSVAKALMDVMAEGAGKQAKYLFITGSLTAANQNLWMAEMEKYQLSTYPQMKNLSVTPKASQEDQAMATQVAVDSLKAYPNMTGMFGMTSVALPGAAEALRKARAADRVFLTGLSTPNSMREYVKDGTVKSFVLWNPIDLGYLTVYVAYAAIKGEILTGASSFKAGRIGEVRVEGDQIILGTPIVFNQNNIDNFDF
jgi:rhamnose transport system substrate-binding protein